MFEPELNLALKSAELKDNEAFSAAVHRLFNNYLAVEEKWASGLYDEKDERELTAKIKRYALMRTALTHLVAELDAIMLEGQEE